MNRHEWEHFDRLILTVTNARNALLLRPKTGPRDAVKTLNEAIDTIHDIRDSIVERDYAKAREHRLRKA